MKIKLCLFSLLCTSLAFTSCKKNDFSHQSDFEKSYNEWLKFKGTSANSYRYTVSGGSWSVIGWHTIITISEGEVVKRYYKLSFPAGWTGTIPGDDTTEWTENENKINSHENTSAAEPITLDDIYQKARNNWLKKRSNSKIYFEATNNG
ncbi:MAG: hypothetical protein ABI267_07870 [Ginsengibacter sp.]